MKNFSSIDLHTHIRGSIHSDDIRRLAQKNNVHVNSDYLHQHEVGSWNSFENFLQAYSELGSVVKTLEDWTFIVENYLARVAATGTMYVEFMVSPANSIDAKINYHDLISAISLGMKRGFINHGIRSGIIITCVRHNGPHEAIKVAEMVRENVFDEVLGFGLTGNEKKFEAESFSSAFKLAKTAGLKLTAHTGEWLSARTVLDTVNVLELDRVGHGIQVVKDEGILKELIAREIGFELCISSNFTLGAIEGFQTQPLLKFYEAGAKFALCTDDPEFFRTSPSQEYQKAELMIGKTDGNFIKQTNLNAIDISFAKPLIRESLRKQVE